MYHRVVDKFLNTTIKKKIIFLMGGVMTITPTILIALLASSYYYLGISKLFNNTIKSSLSQTVEIAQLYLQEHKANIKADTLAVAHDIEMNLYTLTENPNLFNDFLNKQANLRGFSEAMVFTKNAVLGKTNFSLSLSFERLPEDILHNTEYNNVIILDKDKERVRALLKLNNFIDTYLLIGKYVDKTIINHVKSSQGLSQNYNKLLKDVHSTQLKLKIAFICLAILLCILSIYLAKKFAKKIALPLNKLIDATDKVKKGDLSIRLNETNAKDETAVLTRAFNNMTEKLAQQTDELMEVNYLIDKRRIFIESVLKEISAGIIVCSTKGIITLCNDSAYKLLHEEKTLVGTQFKEKLADFEGLLIQCQEHGHIAHGHLKINRLGKEQYLSVTIGAEINPNNGVEGYIITFDDVTNLIFAQREAAWSDVAKRIAHEIKNPLTPISLSAERLQLKFANEITSNPKLFEKYTQTIINHVSNIGNIVEDFVKFAQIKPKSMTPHSISKIINEIMFSYKNSYPYIDYVFDNNVEKDYIICDRTQICQVLINIIKNASEAIQASQTECEDKSGTITITLDESSSFITINILDDGPGIPADLINSITQPYVSTKEKGTGLGLSIVKKIVEDHGGKLAINNQDHGARISFSLRKHKKGVENE